MKLNGSQIVMECLKEQGVDTVFGYPGGTILNIYDALYQTPGIKHVLTSHEQGAAHAADGYARATGKVGVCFATSGPGATNLVTGIATAYMDSIPLVAITANVSKPMLGKDSFQEIDISGVCVPITKHSMIVKNINELADTLRRAFRIAMSGRRGPVLVDITKDVTAAECEYEYKKPVDTTPDASLISDAAIVKAAQMINGSKKPFIFVGGGAVASGAYEEVRAFADKLDAPVCDSLMGKGVFPGTDQKYTGMIGMHGTKASNLGLYSCDLFIALGARFSDRCFGNPSTFPKSAKVLQIDIDAAEVNKNVKVSHSVTGDVKEVLKRLMPLIEPHRNEDWIKKIRELKTSFPLTYDMKSLTGPSIVNAIYEATGGNATIVTDVGQHQMWAAQYYKYTRPRQLLTSGGLGTMGYGLGAAMGAKVGTPSNVVINISGDGCFRMNLNEMATVSRNDIPIIEIVINNHVLGMVRQWQTLFYGKRYSNTILEDKVDFVKTSEGLGVHGVKVTTLDEFKDALDKAIKSGNPEMIECIIEKDDKVFPMIPAGAANAEVFDDSDLN